MNALLRPIRRWRIPRTAHFLLFLPKELSDNWQPVLTRAGLALGPAGDDWWEIRREGGTRLLALVRPCRPADPQEGERCVIQLTLHRPAEALPLARSVADQLIEHGATPFSNMLEIVEARVRLERPPKFVRHVAP